MSSGHGHKIKHIIGTPLKSRHNTPIHQPGKRLMHSIPLRFVQKHVGGHGHKATDASLNLTSMIDFLLTVVLFLLSNFGTAQEMASQQGLEVPTVPHADQLHMASIVSVSERAVMLDGRPVASPQEVLASTDRIDRLFERLQDVRRTWAVTHPTEPFAGDIIFQVDRGMRWELIKRVAQTCALAGFTNLNFAVQKGTGRMGSGGGEGAH